MICRRWLLIALSAALLPLASARAQSNGGWDGTWTGSQGRGKPAAISIAIAGGKVTSYTIKGAPVDVQYTQITPVTVSFGDRDHYFVKLKKTGDTTAAGKIHGRLGYGPVTLTKQ